MASVRKRKWTHNGVEAEAWVVDFTDPAGKRRSKQFDKKKDADRYRTEVENSVLNGTFRGASRTTAFAAVCEDYLRDCDRRWKVQDRMSGLTLQHYNSVVRGRIIPKLGRHMLADVSAPMVQDMLNDELSRLSWRTAAATLVCVRNIFDFAVAREILHSSPILGKKVRVPRNEKRRSIPSKEELRALLAVTTGRQKHERISTWQLRAVAVVLAMFTGMRRGEICGLQWSNLDFENGVIEVRHSLSIVDGLKAPKSASGVRDIPMARPVREILQRLRSTIPGSPKGHVLTTATGSPVNPNDIYGHWKVTMKAAGLTAGPKDRPIYTFHDLRHVAVSLALEQGLDIVRVKELAGHSSVQITIDTYGHLFKDDSRTREALQSASDQFSSDTLPPVEQWVSREERRILKREMRQGRSISSQVTEIAAL